jgi:glyoxylase-like metal-dependent hydrolase (beta-lactamase superfamily II)
MLELVHIAGQTYIIPDSTVIGVYVFDDNTCLLIDSAANVRAAKKIYQLLMEQGLEVWGIFNTHMHGDHTGGNKYIQDRSSCRILARPQEALFITDTMLQAQLLYSSAPPKILKNAIIVPEPSVVTNVVNPGLMEIKGQTFEVINLQGHTNQHSGLVTPDGVSFTGDSLIDPDMLHEYPFIYLSDLTNHLRTLDYMTGYLDGPVILSHGGPCKNVAQCLLINRQIVGEIIDFYLDALRKNALSREELIALTMDSRFIHQNTIQYYMTLTTVSAYLSYLCDQRVIHSFIQDGYIRYKMQTEL